MKKITTIICGIVVMTMSFTSCKSKPKDADIKTSVETALRGDPMSSGAVVNVDKGIVTISGMCNDEASKSHTGDLVKGIKGVKSVVNNCELAPPPAPTVVVNPGDEELMKGLTDAFKDNPGVKFSVVEGKIVLAGEIAKAKWAKLKQTLDKLKSKGYELTNLKIN